MCKFWQTFSHETVLITYVFIFFYFCKENLLMILIWIKRLWISCSNLTFFKLRILCSTKFGPNTNPSVNHYLTDRNSCDNSFSSFNSHFIIHFTEKNRQLSWIANHIICLLYANNQETEAIYNNRKLTSKISIKMPIIYGIGPEEPGVRGAFALSDFLQII